MGKFVLSAMEIAVGIVLSSPLRRHPARSWAHIRAILLPGTVRPGDTAHHKVKPYPLMIWKI